MLNLQCTNTTQPCWETYFPHEQVIRPLKWVIDLARANLQFRVRALASNPSIEDVQNIIEAGHLLISLLDQQWRDCVREPFDFVKKETKPAELKLEDLDL